MPLAGWAEGGKAIFSEEDVQEIRDAAPAIRAQVEALAKQVGAAAGPNLTGGEIQEHYLEFFYRALAVTMPGAGMLAPLGSEELRVPYMKSLATTLGSEVGTPAENLAFSFTPGVEAWLRQPLPKSRAGDGPAEETGYGSYNENCEFLMTNLFPL